MSYERKRPKSGSWVFETAWPPVEVIARDGETYRGAQVFGWVFWKDKLGEYRNQWTGFPGKEVGSESTAGPILEKGSGQPV